MPAVGAVQATPKVVAETARNDRVVARVKGLIDLPEPREGVFALVGRQDIEGKSAECR